MNSLQFPLGIIMKNENQLDEMVDILTTLHQYIPLYEVQGTSREAGAQADEPVTIEMLHKVLFGGDLLTAVRAKGAQRIRQNSEHPVGRLEGFIPVAEDWHAKVVLMEVCHYHNTTSCVTILLLKQLFLYCHLY